MSFSFSIEDELVKYDKRLAVENSQKILKVAKKEGFNSCYLYLSHLIYAKGLKPSEIIEKLKIQRYVYFGMANKISLLRRDNTIQKEKQKFEKQIVKGKMCGYCGKRKRVYGYYCKVCYQRANQLSKQIDLDMMGEY